MTDPAAPVPDDARAPQLQAELALGRRLAADHAALLQFLSGTLEAQIPAAVKVHRRGLFNLGSARKVTVTLGDVHYELALEGGRLTTTTGKVVGGIALEHRAVPVEAWIAGLLEQLRTTAAGAGAVAAALADLAGPPPGGSAPGGPAT